MNQLFKLRNRLEEAVEQKDTDFLRQCLSGKYLPVLGGNERPADIILQALSAPSFSPEWSNRLTILLADLVNERVKLSGNIPDDNLYLYNLFLIASYLPRNSDLFLSLKNCYQTGLEINDYGKIRRQLCQTLTFQQIDQSFEETWMSYFKNISPNTVELSREQRGELLDAWQGLLWIPPTAEESQAGQIVSMKRIDRGLRALHGAVYRTTDDVNILRYAIRLLNDSYPRSSGFWVKCFSDYFHDYPILLQDALVSQWPMLDNSKLEDISALLSEELQSIWKLFTKEKQEEIKEIITLLDASQWEQLWGKLFFEQAPKGLSDQVWRGKLNEIKNIIERQYSELSPQEENLEHMQDFTHSTISKRKEKTKRGKRLGIDRLAAGDLANKVVTEIDKLLLKGNLEKAKSYFDDIINKQKNEGSESEYIAKTLCNVATIAKEKGYFDWSEEIYILAQEEHPNDVVVHNGLADTLKAQDKLKEAEDLYRKNTTRWSNNVVAHNGLAKTLKAQDKLKEAEEIYRQNINRWPNNVVAKHGLANVLRKLRQYEEALSLIPETISFDSIQKQYDAHLRCMVLLERGDIEQRDVERARTIVTTALKSNLSLRQHKFFESARITVELKEKKFQAVLEDLNKIPESPATNVFRLHAHAGAMHTNEANQMYNQLSSTDSRIPGPVRFAATKIGQGYFQKGIEELKTPTNEEFDEVIRAEIDMVLSLAA